MKTNFRFLKKPLNSKSKGTVIFETERNITNLNTRNITIRNKMDSEKVTSKGTFIFEIKKNITIRSVKEH